MDVRQGFLGGVVGMLCGVVLVMGFWLYSEIHESNQIAIGQTAAGPGNIVMATGKLSGKGDADAVYLYDNESKCLLVYFVGSTGLEMLSGRRLDFDWQIQEYSAGNGKHSPTRKDVEEALKRVKPK